jgi:hypothetical protein
MRIFTGDQFQTNQIKAVIMAGMILLSLIIMEELVFFTDEKSCEELEKKYAGKDVSIACDNTLVLFFVAPNLIIFFLARSFIWNHLEKKRNKTWHSYR